MTKRNGEPIFRAALYVVAAFVISFLAYAGARQLGEVFGLDDWALDWVAGLVWVVAFVLLVKCALAYATPNSSN